MRFKLLLFGLIVSTSVFGQAKVLKVPTDTARVGAQISAALDATAVVIRNAKGTGDTTLWFKSENEIVGKRIVKGVGTPNDSTLYLPIDSAVFSSQFSGSGTIGSPITIISRIGTVASSSSVTPDVDSYDQLNITALATNLTINAPTGTSAGWGLLIRIKDNGTSRTLTWNSKFRAGTDFDLPTSTTISKTMYVQFLYNADDDKYDSVGLSSGY